MVIASEDVILQAIVHSIRRAILRLLRNEPQTFSQLLNHFNLSTGKLNYHLTQIQGLVKKNDKKEYELTSIALKILKLLDEIQDEIRAEDQPLIKEAYLAQRNSATPLVKEGIKLGIGAISFAIAVTTFINVLFIIDGTFPYFLIPIIVLIYFGEIAVLKWLITVRKTAPVFIERLNKYLNDPRYD